MIHVQWFIFLGGGVLILFILGNNLTTPFLQPPTPSTIKCVGSTALNRTCHLQNVCWNRSKNDLHAFRLRQRPTLITTSVTSPHYRKVELPSTLSFHSIPFPTNTTWVRGLHWEISPKFINEFGHFLFDHLYVLWLVRRILNIHTTPTIPLFYQPKQKYSIQGFRHSFQILSNTSQSLSYRELSQKKTQWVCFESLIRGNGNLGVVHFMRGRPIQYEKVFLWEWSREIIVQGTGHAPNHVKHVGNTACIARKQNRRRILNFWSLVEMLKGIPSLKVVIVNGTQSFEQQVEEMQQCQIFISQFGSIAFKALFLPVNATFILFEDIKKHYYHKGLKYERLWKHIWWLNIQRMGLDQGVICKNAYKCNVPINATKLQALVTTALNRSLCNPSHAKALYNKKWRSQLNMTKVASNLPTYNETTSTELRRLAHRLWKWHRETVLCWYPGSALSPMGGTLHSVLRFGQIFINSGDPHAGDGIDNDLDVFLFFPTKYENVRAARKQISAFIRRSLVQEGVCRSIRVKRLLLTCYQENTYAQIGIMMNVDGELSMGKYASFMNNTMPVSWFSPPKPCLLGNDVWQCPRDAVPFQAKWERGEYTRRAKASAACMWTQNNFAREPLRSYLRRSLLALHRHGFQSYYELSKANARC